MVCVLVDALPAMQLMLFSDVMQLTLHWWLGLAKTGWRPAVLDLNGLILTLALTEEP